MDRLVDILSIEVLGPLPFPVVGNQTVFPGGIGSLASVGLPTIIADQIVYPFGIGSGMLLGSPTVVSASPLRVLASDTLRGGRRVTMAFDTRVLDLSWNRGLLERALPTGWSAYVSGTGTVAPRVGVGVEVDTGLTGGSFAGLASVGALAYGDVSVKYKVLDTHGTPVATAQVAVLEWMFGAVPVRVTVASDGLGGLTAPASGTLRLVRYGGSVWGFVNDVLTVVQTGLSDVAGVLRFYAGPLRGVRSRVRFTSFVVGNGCVVAGRLMTGVASSTHQVSAVVPAARLEDLGLVPLAVFGPLGVQLGLFTYLLPRPSTVGTTAASRLLTVQNPAQRDGD